MSSFSGLSNSSSGALRDLQAYVDSIVVEHGIPAVSVAVWHGGRAHRAASGILNMDTGVTATVDSVFQIGSISKVFTASLIMLLVDRGRIELDERVKRYMPDFHVGDPAATQAITVRHLLSHTSGLASDFSHSDEACEDGSIARYVDRYFLLPQVHKQFGERFSYSNAGYVIAGRLIELLSGMSWRRAVEEYILKPLQMTHSLVCPTQVLRFRAAMGHVLSGGVKNRKAAVHSRCYLPLGIAPTGSVLTMSAADLLKFGKVHLNGGKTEAGHEWMSESSINVMQQPQVDLPAPSMMFDDAWGVGWGLKRSLEVQAFGHGGGTSGQQALLEIVPECQAAFAIQVNGMKSGGASAIHGMLSTMLYEIAGVKPERAMPTSAKPKPSDLARYVGKFGEAGFTFEVAQREGQLYGQMSGFVTPAEVCSLRVLGENRFAAYTPDGERMDEFTFLEPDDQGRPTYLFSSWRLYRRM